MCSSTTCFFPRLLLPQIILNEDSLLQHANLRTRDGWEIYYCYQCNNKYTMKIFTSLTNVRLAIRNHFFSRPKEFTPPRSSNFDTKVPNYLSTPSLPYPSVSLTHIHISIFRHSPILTNPSNQITSNLTNTCFNLWLCLTQTCNFY